MFRLKNQAAYGIHFQRFQDNYTHG